MLPAAGRVGGRGGGGGGPRSGACSSTPGTRTRSSSTPAAPSRSARTGCAPAAAAMGERRCTGRLASAALVGIGAVAPAVNQQLAQQALPSGVTCFLFCATGLQLPDGAQHVGRHVRHPGLPGAGMLGPVQYGGVQSLCCLWSIMQQLAFMINLVTLHSLQHALHWKPGCNFLQPPALPHPRLFPSHPPQSPIAINYDERFPPAGDPGLDILYPRFPRYIKEGVTVKNTGHGTMQVRGWAGGEERNKRQRHSKLHLLFYGTSHQHWRCHCSLRAMCPSLLLPLILCPLAPPIGAGVHA